MSLGFATCDACARHVRAQDTHCPFCQAAITVAPRGPVTRGPRLHRSRAAILAGAALAIGCSSSDSTGTGGSGDDDGGGGGEAGMAQPVYGAPVGDGGGALGTDGGGGTGGGGDASIGEPAYGAPIHGDGGIDDDDGGFIQPVYGSPTPLP